MKTYIECIPCILNQGIGTAKRLNTDESIIKEMLGEMMEYLSKTDYSQSPPFLVKDVYKIIKKHLKTDDPYNEIKSYFNNELLNMEAVFQEMIDRNLNKYGTVLKLAIIGNIIDFGAKHDIDKETILEFISNAEEKKLFINDSIELYQKLSESKIMLYLGDNCGEIVFDKLLIKFLKNKFKDLEILYGVRGIPILNDVTLEDAKQVGIDRMARVVDNGSDASGTILSEVSPEFREIFYNADIIISKGQGNFESLSQADRKDIFFLFMAKCDLVANNLGAPKMSLICKKIDN